MQFTGSILDILSFLKEEISDHNDVLGKLYQAIHSPFEALVTLSKQSLKGGGKILFCGNGGSAADSQHLATELVVRYKLNRPALPAIALTTDSSLLTACANDFSFEDIFSRQIEGLGRPGDILIGISTSGHSPNILKALKVAKELGLTAAGFSGRDGGAMKGLADPLLIVPSNVTARIQEMHILLGHCLCDLLERDHF
jgi:D-sedoheptulose 7-phosphate isomerase